MHGAAAPIFCTVNGTFSFRRDEKKMWGWNSGFKKLPRSDWQRSVRTKYAKQIPALRLSLFCRTLRCGTFPRRKVPKGRQEGCFESPLLQLPATTPQSPEGSLLGAIWKAQRPQDFYPFSHCFSPLGLRKNQIWKGMDTKKVSPSAMGWVSWMPVRPRIAGSTTISGT